MPSPELVYYLPNYHNLTLRLRYDYNRLTTDDWDQFFANHSIVAIADMPFPFGRAMQLNLGALANVSFAADPSGPQRSDFEVYAGLSCAVQPLVFDGCGWTGVI